MIDYENLSTPEVQKLVKAGDNAAMFEMAWRLELLPDRDKDNPVERCAWQDYWFEKAADAGNVDARFRYARSLIDRIMDKEDRQKAMKYFQSLVDDLSAGKLNKDQQDDGYLAKLWLGVMLCEGFHTQRDAVKGAELIQDAHTYFNGFDSRFGFSILFKIGELYTTGFAQEGEDPSIPDLKKAVDYLERAIERFNPQKDKPEMLDFAKRFLGIAKERINTIDGNNTTFVGAKERREKMLKISDVAQQRLDAEKAAIVRLQKRLAQESW